MDRDQEKMLDITKDQIEKKFGKGSPLSSMLSTHSIRVTLHDSAWTSTRF